MAEQIEAFIIGALACCEWSDLQSCVDRGLPGKSRAAVGSTSARAQQLCGATENVIGVKLLHNYGALPSFAVGYTIHKGRGTYMLINWEYHNWTRSLRLAREYRPDDFDAYQQHLMVRRAVVWGRLSTAREVLRWGYKFGSSMGQVAAAGLIEADLVFSGLKAGNAYLHSESLALQMLKLLRRHSNALDHCSKPLIRVRIAPYVPHTTAIERELDI